MDEELQKGFDMTPETKAYLDEHFKHIEKILSLTIKPITDKIEDYREDFLNIFKRLGIAEAALAVIASSTKDNSDSEARLVGVEKDVAILKDNKGSRQTNIGTILIIVSLAITTIVAIAIAVF